MVVLALLGCKAPTEESPIDAVVHPRLMVTPGDRTRVLDRLGREPFASALSELETRAAGEWREPDPDVWDHSAWGHNGEIAEANAFIAWLLDDADAAEKARSFLLDFEGGFNTNTTWDVNIRMPHPLMGFTNAHDLLWGAGELSEAEAESAGEVITEVTSDFYARYVLDPVYRGLSLGFSQNNHPIRTASSIGYVALGFPEHPEAEAWRDWAISELDYLWSEGGQYVQADGGVSEGPFYYGFAFGPAAAFFIAADNALDASLILHRDCINRQDVDPWTGHGCVDGEAFAFENPLRSEPFQAAVDWSIAIRLPSGQRPPLGDAYFNPHSGIALMSGFGMGGHVLWDWETNEERPYEMTSGIQAIHHHLVHVDDSVEAVEPAWYNRMMPDAGMAVFRSGWDPDARWGMLVAEHGSARKTLHDHVDGTSFTVAAYGEYLLIDPGYYKPSELNNALTSAPTSHNVILIDGVGAPAKGLLTDWGDTDAFLRNTLDVEGLAYAEAHQSYEDTDIERSMIFVDGAYFVIADRLQTTRQEAREHRWRLHGYAGYESGGSFELRDQGARWERTLAGIEVYLASTSPGLQPVEPEFVEFASPHVQQFDLARSVGHHAVMDGLVEGVAPGFLAVLAPYQVAGEEFVVLDLGLSDGWTGWSVDREAGVELIILRQPEAPESFTLHDGTLLETDAELVLVQPDGELALMARGTRLLLDGVSRLEGAGEVESAP